MKDLSRKQKKTLRRILAAVLMIAALKLLDPPGALKPVLYLVPYLTAGYDILIKAFKGIRNRQPFDENFLMAAATVGAMALGEYTEGAAVMVFYQIGELFQSIAVGKSRRSISALMDIRPDYANVETENGVEQTDPDEVPVGTVIVVKPGEKVPIDGVVVSGESSLDTAALTGESLPREASEGTRVQSGCINLTSVLRIRTEKEFGESTASKILELVENAAARKARSEKFISKFARWYTPAVCGSAVLLAVLPPLAALLSGRDPAFSSWIYRALTFLVISCPCALVISIPLTFFAGIGGASSNGVLVKGASCLETLSKVRYMLFDKTGTLTKGSFEVTAICGPGDKDRILHLATYAESWSDHPISRSLREAYGKPLDASLVTEAKEISGHGVTAVVEGVRVACGNVRLMALEGLEPPDSELTGTFVHVAADGEYLGYIVLSDTEKPGSAEAVRLLKASGIRECVMLTGDAERFARAVAERLGIDRVYAGLLPQDKVAMVEKVIAGAGPDEKVAFVGDGINDAPVLSRADAGIAMGALGSDAAIEAADVVLMDDDPRKVALAMRAAKKTMRIVYENIGFAIGVKLLCLLLGALGLAGMWAAIFADVGVMVICVLNAVRALRIGAPRTETGGGNEEVGK